MVRRRAENGTYYHEPPYTEEEELALYRMMGAGPFTILRQSPPAASPEPPHKSPRPAQEE